MRTEWPLFAPMRTFAVCATFMKRAEVRPARCRCGVSCALHAKRETRRLRSRYLDESQLFQCGYAIVQPDFFDYFAVFEPEHGGTGEAHFPTSRSR